MNELYETKISIARWIAYDIPGNIGWILYLIYMINTLKSGTSLYSLLSVFPMILMLVGIIELISERIAKLDRILPKKRLLRGFGALTLGGATGVLISLFGIILYKVFSSLIMLAGSMLCAIFAGLIFAGFRKQISLNSD